MQLSSFHALSTLEYPGKRTNRVLTRKKLEKAFMQNAWFSAGIEQMAYVSYIQERPQNIDGRPMSRMGRYVQTISRRNICRNISYDKKKLH